MPNFKNRLPVQDRLGHSTRIEYVNRQGDLVDPKTGRRVSIGNKIKENGTKVTKMVKSAKSAKRHLPVKKRGMMFGGLDPIPTDPARDPPPRVCFNCWQPGHSRRLCPRPVVTLICNNCGRRGEDLSSCPRCKRAHKEYLTRLQAKERGEILEPSEIDQLLPGEGDEEDDGYDDVLRDLIHKDEMVREQMMYDENPRESLHVANFEKEREKEKLYYQQERAREEVLYRQRKRERETALYLEQERNREPLYLEQNTDREPLYLKQQNNRESLYMEQDRDREPHEYLNREKERRDMMYLERKEEVPLFERERCRENQARHIANLIHGKESERDYEHDREQENEHEQCLYHRERPSRSENTWNRLDSVSGTTKCSIVTASGSDAEVCDDPVKEILELAKSIAHLTPETQDLIMRQVMAERKEKARIRAMKLDRDYGRERESDHMVDSWP